MSRGQRWATGVATVVALAALPWCGLNAYHVEVLTTAGIYALLAVGLNIIVGWAGLLHLGFAAFYAVGAYTYGLLNLHYHWPFWAGLPVSAAAAGVAGVLLGIPAMRVRGDYLAMVTLGFGEIVRLVLVNLHPWTGGPNGLLGIAHPSLGGWSFGVASLPYYYLVVVLVGLALGVCHRIARARLGLALTAIREDELAAACLGIDTMRLKLTALGCGAAMAGVAGCVFAAKQGTITPDSFDFLQSVMILAMVVLGGLGHPVGAVAGAVVLSVLPELLREFAVYRMLLFGVAMIVVMRWRPQGLLGNVQVRQELQRP